MYIDEICPNCDSSDKVYLVSGGYLCESCEARLVMKDGVLVEVTDFISEKEKIFREAHEYAKMIMKRCLEDCEKSLNERV